MNTAHMSERIAEVPPRLKATAAGVFYLLTIVLGGVALSVHGRLGVAVDLVATACYIAVTALFYDLFKPVDKSLSLLAASFNLAGLALGKLDLHPQGVDLEMVFVGLYGLLMGYLIFRSTFLPPILGALMAIGGLGWLTFLSPAFADHLAPYNLAPGILGGASLTLWLLVIGVNAQRWKDRATAAGTPRPSAPCHL
jgi:Domain of unknown function (DUF4386)